MQRKETIRLRDECLVALLCFDTVRISLFAIASHVYIVTGCTAWLPSRTDTRCTVYLERLVTELVRKSGNPVLLWSANVYARLRTMKLTSRLVLMYSILLHPKIGFNHTFPSTNVFSRGRIFSDQSLCFSFSCRLHYVVYSHCTASLILNTVTIFEELFPKVRRRVIAALARLDNICVLIDTHVSPVNDSERGVNDVTLA